MINEHECTSLFLIFYENKQNKILKNVTLLIIVTKPIIFHKQTKKSTINAQESMIWYIHYVTQDLGYPQRSQ